MRSTFQNRLCRLEKTVSRQCAPDMIIWRVIDPRKPDSEPVRCKNIGTGQAWDREPGESAETFERRMVEQARLLPGVPWLVMQPADTPEGENERDG